MRRYRLVTIVLVCMAAAASLSAEVIVSHALAMRGEPKYPPDSAISTM